MKALCPREGLLAACQLAAVALPSRDVKPILRNLKVVGDKNGWTLMATDLELGVRLELRSVKVEKAGEALLPASKLTAILREATDDEVTIEADGSGSRVIGAHAEFDMPGEDPGEFPEIVGFKDDKYHEVTAGSLREMIRRTVFAAARESARYSMTGVLWEFAGEQVRLVATDGRRLAVASSSAVNHGAGDTKGRRTSSPPRRWACWNGSCKTPPNRCASSSIPTKRCSRPSGPSIYSRLVEGRYPNYQEVIPKKTGVKILLETGTFQSAVRQAAIMTDEETKRVIFTFTKGKLTLQAEASESGKSKVELPLDYDGKELKINFDANFLTDMLRVLPPEASLTLELVDVANPGAVPPGFGLPVRGDAADLNGMTA